MTQVMKQTLLEGIPALDLQISDETADRLCAFGAAVVEQNAVMNLTAITEPDAVAKLHLLDSLTVLTVEKLAGKTIIDVGCGAGFPGVPVAIACPEAKVTLLDIRYVATEFLPQVVEFGDQDVLFLYSTPVLNQSAMLK